MLTQILLGLALAAAASILAWRLRSLTTEGAYAATLLGTVVYGVGGWQWAAVLLAFFIGSSALTAAFKRSQSELSGMYEKGGQRDQWQVLCNGGVAGAFVILHSIYPASVLPWIGFAGALAAANADTWATELGALDPGKPRMLTSPRTEVEKGTSGAVSIIGTTASLAGAVAIALLAGVLGPQGSWSQVFAIASAGLLGSLVDSLLGGTVQAIFYCPVEKKQTEKHPLHTCGAHTIQVRGWKWLRNDAVNAVCTGTGAALAIALFLLLQTR